MFYMLTNLLLLLTVISFSREQKNVFTNSSVCIVTGCICTPTAVTCNFSMQQDFNIDANSLPPSLYQFNIVKGRKIEFEAGSFSKIPLLKHINIKNVSTLSLQKFSFLNTLHALNLEILNVNYVEIESKSFYLLRGPVALIIKNCSQLRIQKDAIPWIYRLIISDVSNFELSEKAFFHISEKNAEQGYNTEITMTRVSMNELPKNSFPSSTTEIKLLQCDVKTIRQNAFSALEVDNIEIENCTFTVVESEAFSEKSLLQTLQLRNVNINQMCTGAIFSAVINFSISDSNIEVVETEAFNMSTMIDVSFTNNVFLDIRERGIILKEWKKTVFENNTLRNLDTEAIKVPFSVEYDNETRSKFRFVGNILENVKEHSLNLNIGKETIFNADKNIFVQSCQCDLRSYVKNYIKSNDYIIDSIYNNSYCAVRSSLAKCFNYSEGFMKISNFTNSLCNIYHTISCVEQNKIVTEENPNIYKAINILNEQKQEKERKIITVIIGTAIAGFILIIVLGICIWFNHKKYFQNECIVPSFSHVLLSLFSRLIISNNITRTISSNSITRVSIHEYAEVWPQKLLDNDSENGTYICEDKATQTLPEELTQELLQTLREKLDDPENYKEARSMIEHLYDLIKVEECCNNNVFDEINPNMTENIYDVIKPNVRQRVQRYERSFKTLANKGTRAPSPDKLLPQPYTTLSFCDSLKAGRRMKTMTETIVTEYTRPSDQYSHIYSKPIYDQINNADKIYSNFNITISAEYKDPHDVNIPIYSELVDLVNAPQPVLIRNNVDDKTETQT